MYVIFEGIDGVGKSTQIKILADKFKDAVITKEPGGSKFGEYLRQILLGGEFRLCSRAEALLFLADRAEHYDKVVLPNFDKLILSDRGFISGIAYALANDENADINELIALNKFALNGGFVDKVVLFRADENLVRQRLKSRGQSDAIEARGLKYLMRVQDFMQKAANASKIDTLIIDAQDDIGAISDKIEKFIKI